MPVTTWRGAIVAAQAIEAAKLGVDRVMSECVKEAKTNHPYQNQTGTAEGSVRIVDQAEYHASTLAVVGRWGSVDVGYFIFLELGTVNMQPYPSLRPAADKFYPSLGKYIRQEMAKMA